MPNAQCRFLIFIVNAHSYASWLCETSASSEVNLVLWDVMDSEVWQLYPRFTQEFLTGFALIGPIYHIRVSSKHNPQLALV